MKIIVIGANNSGKGTLVKRLHELTGFEVIGCSNKLETSGLDIRTGKLLSDEDVNSVMLKALKGKDNFILEGYPRTINQNKAMLIEMFRPHLVVALHISKEEVLRRAVGRRICSSCGSVYNLNGFRLPKQEGVCDYCKAPILQRKDDEEEAVIARYNEYMQKTFPVVVQYRDKKYENILLEFEATEGCEKISQEILNHINHLQG